MIWMLHPLQTEAVNYLSERTESMMGLFYLLTLYCSIRAAGAMARATRWRIAASVLACASGMACKESMVTAPFMVALYDRVFLFDSLKDSFRARWRLYAGLPPPGWGSRAHARWSPLGLGGLSPSAPARGRTCSTRRPMIVRYLRLTVWPAGLVLDYGCHNRLRLATCGQRRSSFICLLLATAARSSIRPRLGFLAPGSSSRWLRLRASFPS